MKIIVSPNSRPITPCSVRAALRLGWLIASLLVVLNPKAATLLFDFGADATQTVAGPVGEAVHWNDVSAGIGADDLGFVPNLVNVKGEPTDISFQMVSRFNGANESGTAAGNPYPASATRDSLFGNTEVFGNLENISPIFKLTGLAAGTTYNLTFYASRLGVTDNRQTRYTVTGTTVSTVDLDAANNVTNTVRVSTITPDTAGEITVALTPGPNNNNANHFTYLGILQIDVSNGQRLLIDLGAGSSSTGVVDPPPSVSWNNITATIGSSDSGEVPSLVTTNGSPTSASLRMIRRFNGANTAGTTASTNFPATATQDSLFGNTEVFSGLTNIFPSFKLTGLDPTFAYSFTFFGSRTGVTDNRETRFTVTGTNSGVADLNAANNVNVTAAVSSIRPTAAGEITIALAPGPNNNNANHFTYLGVMRIDSAPVRSPRILIDFGANVTPTEFGVSDPDNYWNNVTATIGGSDTGALTNLVMTSGTASGAGLQMVSRFNGANENGTQTVDLYPVTATRDSLFGNTELFSGLENVTPIFKLTGLNPAVAYDLLLYASRMSVGDNRETHYTVTGATETTADLNVANNELESAKVEKMKPSAAGEITIALAPSANNDNGNHFIYLGVLQIDWQAPAVSVRPSLSRPAYANGSFSFILSGTAGKTYAIQRTRDFTMWNAAQTVTLSGTSQPVQIPQTESEYFYRAVEQ